MFSSDTYTCVYTHINPISNEVFYVGIGNIHRPYQKSGRSKSWLDYVSDIGQYKINVLFENIAWDDAVKIERDLIFKLGRKDKGLGLLVNNTNGGEGYQEHLRWSYEELQTEALKYDSRSCFFKNSRGAYKAAIRLGVLDEICSHMICKYWTIEALKLESKKYITKSDFFKNSNGAYKAAIKLNVLNEICSHMKVNGKRNGFKLTQENCLEVAKQFIFKSELSKNYKSIYNKIIKMGWQDLCFSHMK